MGDLFRIRWGGMAVVSGWLVEVDSRGSLQYDYSVAFLIMALCWGLDLVVVAGLIQVGRQFLHPKLGS